MFFRIFLFLTQTEDFAKATAPASQPFLAIFNSMKTFQLLYTKNGSKKQLILKKESSLKIAKNGHQAKDRDFAKSSLCGWKKQQILEKWEQFKNGQNGYQAKAIDFAKSSLWVKK